MYHIRPISTMTVSDYPIDKMMDPPTISNPDGEPANILTEPPLFIIEYTTPIFFATRYPINRDINPMLLSNFLPIITMTIK